MKQAQKRNAGRPSLSIGEVKKLTRVSFLSEEKVIFGKAARKAEYIRLRPSKTSKNFSYCQAEWLQVHH